MPTLAQLRFDTTAHAQTPSNTCARERRECLQAHVREGMFGSRYVPPDEGAACEADYKACLNPDACTKARNACMQGAVRRTVPAGAEYVPPEDVARCNDAYKACASRSGSGGQTASPVPEKRSALPPMKRFEIRTGSGSGGGTVDDCRVDGASVHCASRWDNPPSWLTSYTGSFVGRLEGATLTGTTTSHIVNSNAGCIGTEDYNGPVTYILSPGGTARLTAGPIQRRSTFSGACSGASSGSSGPNEATVQWRKLE